MPVLPVTSPDFLRDWPDADQLRQLREAPRGERQELLATFRNLKPADAVAFLATATRLPVAPPLAADTDAVPALPARLVHDFQILPIRLAGAKPAAPAADNAAPADASAPLHLATSWPPDDEMRDWIAIFTPRPIQWHLAPADRLRQLVI